MKQKNVETNDVAKVEATEEVVEQKEVVEVQPQEPKTKAPKRPIENNALKATF